ncbi:MAG: TonB-dependent siderophore receptor [Metallibacterium scheffleri]|jgi:catecholate siderophore receptor|uniref:TonB-dependent receptor n=1 Tax=Metallibacterium scheffleri TaxID=993689 RepID=UPI0026F066DB|nr:TonB-dependent siderophore receptor [Metallibacterium scheffleri]MCK9368020.1 TonB-dependent siderophore receptor [Metallibacterium scheffleri]
MSRLSPTPLAAALAVALHLATPALAHAANADSAAPRDSGHRAPTASGAATAATDAPDPAQIRSLQPIKVEAQSLRDAWLHDRAAIGPLGAQSLRDVPQTLTVLDAALLQSQGVTSLSDALRNVPGITLGGAEGGQIGNNINLRGFSARTDIYLDGMRDRGQYYRDVFDLSSVQVLEGPASMLFGRGSTGGVINQVSKVPEARTFGSFSATIASPEGTRVTADINQPLTATAAFRINAFAQDLHSTREVMHNRDGGIAPSLRLGMGTDTEITLSALLQRNRDMPDYGLPPVNGHPAAVDTDNFYGLTDDRTIQRVGIFDARLMHRFSDALSFHNQLRWGSYTTDARETGASSIVTAAGTTLNSALGNPASLPLDQLYVQLGSHDRVIHDHALGDQADLEARFDTGAIAHTLVTGIELGRDRYANAATSRSGLALLSLLDPQALAQPAGVVSVPRNLAVGQASTAAVYANDTVQLDPHWQLVAGLRRDRFAADLWNSSLAPAYAQQTVYFTSVRGGVIWQPDDHQSYYTSYGTSFDPSLETLTVTNGTQALAPEKNRSLELGGKWNLAHDSMALSAALFDVRKTNARTQVSPGVYALDGDVRVRGLSLGLVGNITRDWQLFAGYALLDARIVKALDGTQGKVPANTPRNAATLWSTWQLGRHWRAGIGAQWQSLRYAANNNVVSAPGYAVYNGMLGYDTGPYSVQLNVFNLADRRYFVSLIPSDGGRSVPGIGRTLQMTFSYRY